MVQALTLPSTKSNSPQYGQDWSIASPRACCMEAANSDLASGLATFIASRVASTSISDRNVASSRSIQRLGSLEQQPRGGDVLVASHRLVAPMRMRERRRRDEQRAGLRRDLALLVQEFGFAF